MQELLSLKLNRIYFPPSLEVMATSREYAPLHERVYVGNVGQSVLEQTECIVPSRPFTYKGWMQESMTSAVKAVIEDGMSVRGAAEYYGVPKSTLCDCISGHVLLRAKSGPNNYLSCEEEEELVNFLCRRALVGHARTRKEVLAIVNHVLSSWGRNKDVSPGWWTAFVAQHPKLTLRTPATLSILCANATDHAAIDCYFDELERTLEENHLTEKPCQIFNMG